MAFGVFGVSLGVFQENVPKSLWPESHLGVFVALQSLLSLKTPKAT